MKLIDIINKETDKLHYETFVEYRTHISECVDLLIGYCYVNKSGDVRSLDYDSYSYSINDEFDDYLIEYNEDGIPYIIVYYKSLYKEKNMIEIKENELYQEIELFVNGEKIGEAEVEIKNKMLSRLSIFPPYQNNGYGTEVVKMLNDKYECNCLWVNADNASAIKVYEKNGYIKVQPTMYLMQR